MFYTIYKITNKINNKFYVGMHKTTNLDDGYMGSGKLIQRAIKKHGVENFMKEILHIFDNEVDMRNKEKELVVLSEESYNLCDGGKGGFGYINRLELNNANKDKEAIYEKVSKSLSGRQAPHVSDLYKERHKKGLMTKYYFGNRDELDSSIQQKANSPESIEKKKATWKITGRGKGEKNSQYGKPRSEETKQKIRDSLARNKEMKTNKE